MAPIFIKQCTARKQLGECTWPEISQMAESGGANGYWHVGDKKEVTLSGEVDGVFGVQIADFDFYEKSDGSGKAGIVFAFTKNVIDADAAYGQLYNQEGTDKVNMLRYELQQIWASLPSELRPWIKTVKVRNARGTTGLLPGSGPHYGPGGPNCVYETEAGLFPPSYAEVTNGGAFGRNYIRSSSSNTESETVYEGPALELYKYEPFDNLSGTALDKGGGTFLRTVYSTFAGYYPGQIYIKGYSISASGKIVTENYSLSHDFREGENVIGTGATLGLCPMFCV